MTNFPKNLGWLFMLMLAAFAFNQTWAAAVVEETSSGRLASGLEVGTEEHRDTSPRLDSLPADSTPNPPPVNPTARIKPPRWASAQEPDPLVQSSAPTFSMPSPVSTFEGIPNVIGGFTPPDIVGDVGPNHYVSAVNTRFAVFNKATGAVMLGPQNVNTLWGGFGGLCQTENRGDPIVLYDHLADRWFITQFAFDVDINGDPVAPFLQCVAISQTPDPLGTYHRYAFNHGATFNDYGKFGVWPDGYYATYNEFSAGTFVSQGVAAYDRTTMLAGLATTWLLGHVTVASTGSIFGMLPSDLDGPVPPVGAPNYFANWNSTVMDIWEFRPDFVTPGNSTFGLGANFNPNQSIPIAAFSANLCAGSRDCIPQPGTAQKVDTLSSMTMFRLQYRNYGTHQSLVTNHTVNTLAHPSLRAAPRWYEFRKTGGAWFVQNQGTFSPDTDNRWMGSAAMDKDGNLAVGYSVSSTTTFPSIRYAGRLAADPANLLSQGEATLFAGSGSQTGSNRWGDYSAMSVDPVDDCTFWYTNQYYAASSTNQWKTRIGSFKFPGCTTGGPGPTCSGSEPIVCTDDGHSVSPALSTLSARAAESESPRVAPEPPLPQSVGAGDFADPVVQDRAAGRVMPSATSFAGMAQVATVVPPDTVGDVGPNHYVQMVNSRMAVYSRAGALLAGPININSIWTGATSQDICRDNNRGDPVVVYDPLANRWFITQFGFAFSTGPDGPFKQCIAISTTPDPTGPWCRYQFHFSDTLFNDYGKFGVWPDGYYGTFNVFDLTLAPGSQFVHGSAVVYERDQMLACQPAREQIFNVPNSQPAFGVLPSDLDGAPPPAGAPNYFFNSNRFTVPATQAHIWEFHTDWATTANSTYGVGATHSPNQTLAVASFDINLCGFSRDCIAQPGTAQKVDTLGGSTMFRLQYRNFGTHQSLVTNLSVDAGVDRAAPRWYELRKTGGPWSVQNQGTFSPDTDNRWMGSAAMDKNGNLAVGYSVSSTTTFPSLRYAGRLATDPANLLSQGEGTLIAGGGSQTGSNRWGDYSAMAVDPVDDCTFWYTNQYYAASSPGGWATRIGSFKYPSCTAVAQVATKLGFTQQPSNANVAQVLPTQPIVAIQDNTNATVTTDSTTMVTLALSPASATLTCTGGLTKQAASGLANFSGCSVSGAGTYTLLATSTPVLAQATSNSFTIATVPTGPVVLPNVDASTFNGHEAEPSIAINPTNPLNIVVVSNAQQGASDGLFRGYSNDGGATWTKGYILGSGSGAAEACCDAGLIFDEFGTLWLSYLDATATDILLVKSVDGGITFTTPIVVRHMEGPGDGFAKLKGGAAVDYPWIAYYNGTLAISYNTGGQIEMRSVPVTGLGTIGTFVPGLGVDGQAAPGSAGGNFGGIAVSPTGKVVVSYQTPSSGQNASSIKVNTDPDGLGAMPFNAAVTVFVTNVGGFDAIPAQNSRTIDAVATVAYDLSNGPRRGRLYIVYGHETVNESSDTDVYVRFSDDDGATWSAAVKVNDDATTRSQFFPRLAVDPVSGQVAVTFYDARQDGGVVGPGSTNAIVNDDVHFYGSYSTDGGVTWAPNLQMSSGVSRSPVLTNANEYGDFTGLSFFNCVFIAAWADTSNSTGNNPNPPGAGNNADMMTGRVTVPGCAVAPVATKLGFTQQPSNANVAQTLPTQPIVAIQDAGGATVTTDSTTMVTLALSPASATLTCTGGLTKQAASGLATFSGCSVSGAGTFTLVATSTPVLTQATSNSFIISAAGNPLVAVEVALGFGHACARFLDGRVKCWGLNGSGQLGLGDIDDRGDAGGEMGDGLPFVALGTGRTAVELAAGSQHMCARLDNGSVKCWGFNDSGGILGLGDANPRGDGPNEMGDFLPSLNLGTGLTAVEIAAGDNHTCARLNTGAVKCWGVNSQGQLGLGDTAPRGSAPGHMGDNLPAVNFGAGRTAVELSGGHFHTCARLDNGAVKCWGINNFGELGLGDISNRGDAPGEMGDALPNVSLGTGRTALGIAAGNRHTCARLDDLTVKCWGRNDDAQLGLGDGDNRGDGPGEMGDALPVAPLGAGRTALALVSGEDHNCVILENSHVKCWGRNNTGALGLGDAFDRGDAPGEMGDNLPEVNLGTGRTALAIEVGYQFTCTVLNGGSVKCWGRNSSGKLGLGDVDHRGDALNEMGDNLPVVALGTGPASDACPGPANITLTTGATGEVYCGPQFSLLALLPVAPIPAAVSAIFSWNNGTQQFNFWFRGFPNAFQTLGDVLTGNFYFFQATGAGQVANTGGGQSLVPSGFRTAGPTFAGANGHVWSGSGHALATLEGYASITQTTAIFSWNNTSQLFNFWFRGFPDNFQTLTNGIERGKYYFFQAPAGQSIPMN